MEKLEVKKVNIGKFVRIALEQSEGLILENKVAFGDRVEVGSLLATPKDGCIGTNLHSSVSGVVRNVELCKLENYLTSKCIVIQNDGNFTCIENTLNTNLNDTNSLLDTLQFSGIVSSLDFFPLKDKYGKNGSLSLIINTKTKTNLVNKYLFQNYLKEILSGLNFLMNAYNISKVYFVGCSHKQKEILKNQNFDFNYAFKLKPAKNTLTESIETLYHVYNACVKNIPQTEKFVYVGGKAINTNGIALLPVGTTLTDIASIFDGFVVDKEEFENKKSECTSIYSSLIERYETRKGIEKENVKQEYENFGQNKLNALKEINEFLKLEKKYKKYNLLAVKFNNNSETVKPNLKQAVTKSTNCITFLCKADGFKIKNNKNKE